MPSSAGHLDGFYVRELLFLLIGCRRKSGENGGRRSLAGVAPERTCVAGVLGIVAIIQNFPTCHQDQSMVSSSNEGGVDLHTLVDRARKRSKNGDEEVVLNVIQITGDPSAERTAPPRSTHVRSA